MAKLPEPTNSTAAKIYEAYEQDAEEAPAVNCRTCAHSTPEMGGDAKWLLEV